MTYHPKTKTCLYCGKSYLPYYKHDGFCSLTHMMKGWGFDWDITKGNKRLDDLERWKKLNSMQK